MTKYIYDERTAPSAPICTFEDGVDGIPTKSLVVTIPPTLSGVSLVAETQTGRNLVNGISGYTVLANATAQTLIGSCEMVANVAYTLSCSMTGTPTARTRNRWAVAKSSNMWDGTAVFGNDFYTAPTQTFTPSENGTYYFFIWSQGIDVDVSYDDFMCELGSTAHAYEPYTAPTTYTANLGGTNHLQNANIVQGTFNSDGSDVNTGTIRIRTDNYIPLTAGTYKIENTEEYEYVVYVYASSNWQSYISAESLVSWQTYGSTFTLTRDRYVRIGWRKPNNTDILPSEIHNYILYDIMDPIRTIYGGTVDIVNGVGTDENGNDFTFEGQEIPTTQGYNAFWSDSGNTEVTYYIQIPVEEKYIINGETLSDIADAIREKKQTSDPILTEDMADEILSIEMGGSDLLDLASQSTFDFTDDTYKTSALTIPDRMFNNNQRIRTVNISGIKTVESYAFIQCKATSLSFPDVETIGYQAFFQCRGASDIPLSIPNVVTIGEEAFKEAYVCGESPSYRFLDISKCVSIGNNAFRGTRINGFKMDSVETLGHNPWFGSWFSMTTVVFPKLKTAHDQMCRGVNFTNLVIGPDWQSCGGGFAGYDMDWRNKYVYVYAIVPPTMGGDFSLWKPPVAFYVPADSVDAYKAAPYWSQYASIILPLPSDHLTIDTWL